MAAKQPRFDAGDFLREETYLQEQHAAGQHLMYSPLGGKLKFAAGEPAEVVYRFDFIPEKMTEQEYIAKVREAGAEYIGRVSGWQCMYFPKDAAPEADNVLFHDDLERGRQGRFRAEREAVIGIIPLAVCYVVSSILKDSAAAESLWKLCCLFLVVAVAVFFPAWRVRSKCGDIMLNFTAAQKAKKEDPEAEALPEAENSEGK